MSIGRLRLLVLFFVAATSLNVLPAQCAEGQTPMQSGMENLDNKRYWSAHTDFKQAVHENPNDQQAYYYLGLSCENLKQHDEAKEAYRACYSINPFSDIGQKARKALLDVSDHMEALKHRAIDNPEIVTKTAVTIQRQAEELQGRKILDGERTANWKIRQGTSTTIAVITPIRTAAILPATTVSRAITTVLVLIRIYRGWVTTSGIPTAACRLPFYRKTAATR